MSTIHVHEIAKQFGESILFRNLSFSINPQSRIGIIGPNGKGKSTFLKILKGIEDVDSGTVHRAKDLIISYADQLVPYDTSKNVQEIINELSNANISAAKNINTVDIHKAHAYLDRFGITDLETPLSKLSGGQRKKIQLSLVFAEDCNLLLLDEPSNHLDMESIIQLEQILRNFPISVAMISHDRKLLDAFATEIFEINPQYPDCYFHSKGSYKEYIEQREAFLEADERQIDSMKNKARTELDWLRQGVKARGTKAKFRQDSAHELLSSVEKNVARRRVKKADIEFSASGRKTKDLIEFEKVSFGFGETNLFSDLDFKLCSGDALGILGPNGSGKSTILKLILSELSPRSGTIKKASSLNVSYFSQFSSHIEPTTPMDRVLAPDGDSVLFQGNTIHVAAWASRFGFDSRSIKQPYGSLSGGEKARLRIATLMLESPDVLLLDEPTNDLDIMTLEVLEDSLLSFNGALILITHDRFMLDTVCSSFLGLDGFGGITSYASCDQYLEQVKKIQKEELKKSNNPSSTNKVVPPIEVPSKNTPKRKLSYNEQRELSMMEESISKAEEKVIELSTKLEKNTDPGKIQDICEELGKAQAKVDTLYKRWEELEN